MVEEIIKRIAICDAIIARNISLLAMRESAEDEMHWKALAKHTDTIIGRRANLSFLLASKFGVYGV